jgi:lipopolysaccharide export system protein LptA
MPPLPILSPWFACCAAALLAAAALPVQAEKADRSKPMTLESDQPCVVNLVKNTSSCSGNVVITQGTLVLRADRVELRETPEGYQLASAIGSDGKPAQYRQKRDAVDEHVEGTAQRIDYDSRANTLRFEGKATARRLRGAVPADEIHGQVILWDNTAEMFNVQGGVATEGNPGGRVRAVLAPREPAASAPAAPASGPALRNSRTLGERR